MAKFMGPTWGSPGSCRSQMGPMLAPRTLLSGLFKSWLINFCCILECSDVEFRCALTGACLPESLRCDGEFSCGSEHDHSDEAGCGGNACSYCRETSLDFAVYFDCYMLQTSYTWLWIAPQNLKNAHLCCQYCGCWWISIIRCYGIGMHSIEYQIFTGLELEILRYRGHPYLMIRKRFQKSLCL